jgi:eukaryotic-like serine/threonine-protein kinase
MGAVQDLATATAAMAWSCPTCGREYPSEFTVCPLDATPRDEVSKVGDPQIGVVLARTYRIVRVLGQGGMARLYEAEHLRIDTRYAVKIIHDELAREPSLLARFEREARAAGRIKSDHVVRLVDVLRTQDERPCLVTELLEGEDLQMRLDRVGKLSLAEAIPIARQLCRGVAAAHAVGVVHRDLKPSNVFLCNREGTPLVKVFDFGVAKIEDDDKLTHTGAVMGTAAYMAPEQARRAADAGPLADVYSVGAILYHMLAGQMPYGTLPAVSRFALLLHEEPARPRSIEPSIPEGVEAVIQHAMARDTASRIESVLELERQLAAFDTTDAAAVPLPVVEHTARTIALRARLARPAAVAVAVGSCIASGAWLTGVLGTLLHSDTRGERTLLAILGVCAVIALAVIHVRALRAKWQSSLAVSLYIAPFARALLGSLITYGSLELISIGWFSIAHTDPFGVGIRLAAAGIAAVLGLGWRAWRLDARLR